MPILVMSRGTVDVLRGWLSVVEPDSTSSAWDADGASVVAPIPAAAGESPAAPAPPPGDATAPAERRL